MSLIIIALAIWSASALIRMAREKRAREQAQRIAYEQERIKREVREMKQRANEETAARIALEREQMRQRREQERLSAEQAKQAAVLEKHEKRIADLECKVRKLDRDIEAQNELLNDYYGQLDWLLLQQSGTTSGSAEFAKWQNKIVSKNNQIRKAENKMADMKDAKDRANRELAA